jgi:hypothetical protein
LQALLKYLPDTLRNHENVHVYAYKDTAALSRHIQQWRTPKNPVSRGRLSSATAKNTFHIGIMHSDSSFKEVHELLQSEKQFAILCPIGIISELSRKENGLDNQWIYDQNLDEKVHLLSKLVLSQDNQVWLKRAEVKETEVSNLRKLALRRLPGKLARRLFFFFSNLPEIPGNWQIGLVFFRYWLFSGVVHSVKIFYGVQNYFIK